MMHSLSRTALLSRVVVSAFALIATPALAQTQPPAGAPAGAPATPPAAGAAGAASTTGTQTATGAAAPAAASQGRASWTADRRDFVVGDIVTVLIDDYTISTAVKDNVATDNRGRNLGLTARMPNKSTSGGLDTRNDASQQQRGQIRRENRFQNEMSVRVVEVGKNGLLKVSGTKLIDVDKARQDIVFTGWVRAQDISPQNMIESSRVADAQIGYASPGPLGKPKQGIITKILGGIWP